MTDLEMLLLRRMALLDLVTECEAALDRHLTKTPDPMATLCDLIDSAGGRATPVGHAADLYRLRLDMHSRRERLCARARELREARERSALPKLLTTTWSGVPPKLLMTTSEPIRPIVPLEIGTPVVRDVLADPQRGDKLLDTVQGTIYTIHTADRFGLSVESEYEGETIGRASWSPEQWEHIKVYLHLQPIPHKA